MIETQPEVFLVSEPSINYSELLRYLESVGGRRWYSRVVEDTAMHDAEILCEFMARGCYKSFDVGLNPNVTKVREDSEAYFQNILSTGHGSVLEHAQFSFYFANVSRVFTHELVRHRAGVAISQESLRYVRLTDLGFRIPAILSAPPKNPEIEPDYVSDRIVQIVETLEEFQRDMADVFGLDDEGVPFHYKKEVTSALRRLAPIGLSTNIGWSANVRTLRFVIQKRTEAAAEEEIRIVFQRVAEVMKEKCPLLFGDFEKNEAGEYVTPYEKV